MTTEYEFDQPAAYRIIIRGILDSVWSDWFDGLSISTQEGDTILNSIVTDQSALHGILAKINDLGLSIISVTNIYQEPEINCDNKN